MESDSDGGRGRRLPGKQMGAGQVRLHPTSMQSAADTVEREDASEMTAPLLVVLAAARRRWKLGLTVWIGVLFPMLVYLITAVPRYSAQGALQVSDAGGPLASNPLLEFTGAGAETEIYTEIEIIRRREFIADVLRRAGMQILDPHERDKMTLDMGVALGGQSPVDPRIRAVRQAVEVAEVSPGWFAPVHVVIHVLDANRLRVRVDGDSSEFAIGEVLQHPRAKLRFSSRPLAIGDSIEFELLPEGALVDRYGPGIHVVALGTAARATNIVQVVVTHTDRETARDIVQTLMTRYLAKSLEWKTQSASLAEEFIAGQLREVRGSLSEAEARLREYSQQEQAIQLDTQAKVAIERAADLQAQRMQIELQEKTISSVLGRIQKGTSPKASLTANFFEDPVLATSIEGLTAAETAFETLRASHTAEHPRVAELGRALALRKREVTSLMRSARQNLSHQKAQIQEELDASTEAMKQYPERELELARLMREMRASERVYTLLLEKHEEAQIMRASTTTDKRIVDTAALPHRRTSPRRGMLLAFGTLGGLLAAVLVLFVVSALERRIDSVDAVREHAPFPTYGTVPLVAEQGGQTAHLRPQHVWENPHEAAPEAFRALGVSVSLLPSTGDRGRVVMVTSSQPKEGKSTIASNLAVSMARMGKRVLILDLDLRKPVMHRVWEVPRAPGYSDLVGQGGGAKDLPRVSNKNEVFGVRVVTAGTPLPDTVTAIMTPSLPALLEAWCHEYDWIVLDSPPAFVAETTALAQHSDLILLVARPGVVERANLRHAVETLGRVATPRGLVLNAVGRQHTGYYYGSGYYYYHSSYGRDGEKQAEKRAAS